MTRRCLAQRRLTGCLATTCWTVICFAIVAVGNNTANADSDAAAKNANREAVNDFETHVRPLIVKHCAECHTGPKSKGGLQIESRQALIIGGESGPAIVPGKPADSLLIEAIKYENLEMPPTRRLSKREVGVFENWIKQGAVWPGTEDKALTPRKPGLEITDEDRAFWSFKPIGNPVPPEVIQSSQYDTNPIDAFVLAQLHAKGLKLSQPATKRELIRRVYFDLIGLPPTPEEVERFLRNDSPSAYAKLVDELLDRPQYGERWGRHWLDLVRFAQSNGYERDDEKPEAWRYRDYVVKAFNDDMPYNQFIREQLAGDEIDEVSSNTIIATGYYRIGVWDDEPDDKKQAVLDELDDILRTTSETFLGLTIGCARCHDHKFDPIPQADYYRLLSFVRNVTPFGRNKSQTHWELNPDAVYAPVATLKELQSWHDKRKQLQSRIDELGRDRKAEKNKERAAKLDAEIKSLQKQHDARPFANALAVREPNANVPETKLLIRGSHLTPGPAVEPAFLSVLGRETPNIVPVGSKGSTTSPMRSLLAEAGIKPTSGRRRALAEWIASPTNPLTPRVVVNRIWYYHFGQGLVPTPNDFGRTGLPPSHPQLLDWLARKLLDGGWRMKPLHRAIVLSRTYQQSSHFSESNPGAQSDPGNRLLWRQNMRRIDAEAIRDSILAVSGRLNLEMGGRGFFPALSASVLSSQSRPGRGWGKSDERQRSRRSVYAFVKRTLGIPFLETFDFPVPDKPEPKRQTTTIAPQALILLNSEFMDQQSRALADRLLREHPGSIDRQINGAYRLAFSRKPLAGEVAALSAFHGRQQQALQSAGTAATAASQMSLAEVCRLIFNLNEFVYVD